MVFQWFKSGFRWYFSDMYIHVLSNFVEILRLPELFD